MTISTIRQSLSNMLRRLFAFLILGVFVAICSCEPVNRKHLLKASSTIGCSDDEDDSSTCGTNGATIITSSAREEQQTRTDRKIRQKLVEDNDNVGEVSARGRKRGRFGKILLYMLGAAKAMLVYGLLHGVAALAGKAVLVAKIALALAIAALLKKNDREKVSYEIVKHPYTSNIHTHSSSIDYDHRSDYGDDRNDYVYENRKRRRIPS